MSGLSQRPWIVGVVGAFFGFVALGSWAASSPVGSSPDDDFHLVSIWCARGSVDNKRCTVVRSAVGGEKLVKAREDLSGAPCFKHMPRRSGACQEDLSGHLVTARSNAGSYPPLYYRVMSCLVGDDIAASVVAMRLLNSLIAIALVSAAVGLCQGALRRAVLLVWMAGMIPLGVFLIASTNPSGWAISGLGTFWAFLLNFLLGPPGRRRVASGVMTVVTFVVACGARADAPVFAAIVTASCVALAMGQGHAVPRRLYALPAALVVAAVPLAFAASAPAVASNGLGAARPDDLRSIVGLAAENLFHSPELVLGAFGAGWGLGWLDTKLPTEVPALVLGALSVLLARALSRASWQRVLTLVPVVAAVILIPVYVGVMSGNEVGVNVQPRYLFPMVLCAMGICLSGLLTAPGTTDWSLDWRGYVALSIALATANLYALQVNLTRYVHGDPDLRALNPAWGVEWWWSAVPLPPLAVWLVGSGAALGALLAASRLAWRTQD